MRRPDSARIAGAWRLELFLLCILCVLWSNPSGTSGVSFVPPRASGTLRAPVHGRRAAFLGAGGVASDWSSGPSFSAGTGRRRSLGWACVLVLAGAASAIAGSRAKLSRSVLRSAKGVRVVDGRSIPWNIVSAKAPHRAKVVENRLLTEPTSGDPNWETRHITIEHDGAVPYLEGQSIGVIAPGPDKKGESPAKVRTYSIASSSVGDDEQSNTVSLCVKRLVQLDVEHANRKKGEDRRDRSGMQYPESTVYRGVCSDFLCDTSPGDEVLISGPTGAEMLLPAEPDANIIMLATGTGIAPMRSYLRLLFHDAVGANTDGSRKFKGLAWLFLGTAHAKSLLYSDEHVRYKERFPSQFRCDYALSREQTNEAGEKMYIQTRVAEHAEELWALMQLPKTHIYVCGLKGMTAGLDECFGSVAEHHGADWKEFTKKMKKNKRYHVEVY